MTGRTGKQLRAALAVSFVALALVLFRRDLLSAALLLWEGLTLALAVGILFCTALHFVNEPVRWWLLLRRQDPPARWTQTYHAIMVTALMSYAFPARLGVPVRIVMARRVLGLAYVTAGALLLVDAAFNYAIWGMVAALGVAILLPDSRLLLPTMLLVVIATGVVLTLFAARRGWMLGNRPQFAAALRLLSLPTGLGNVGLLIFDIAQYGVRHSLILAALGAHLSLLSVTLAVAVSIVAGFVSLMPLGLGAYDLSLVLLLTMMGVGREVAVAVPVINRVASLVVAAILGTASFAHLGLSRHEDLTVLEPELLQVPEPESDMP